MSSQVQQRKIDKQMNHSHSYKSPNESIQHRCSLSSDRTNDLPKTTRNKYCLHWNKNKTI